MTFPSLTEHQLLVFWTQLFVVLAAARLLGALARRLGQPAVLGELLAGVALGPSLLGKAWPAAERWLFGTDPGAAGPLNAVGWIGVGLLLVLTGLETDLALIRRLGRAASSVAACSLLLPLALGLGLGVLLPRSFAGAESGRLVFVLFIGVSLSISSLPVIAKILSELGLMRRDFSQVTIAVGMVNDLVGWLALGVIAGLAESGALSLGRLARSVVAMALLVGLSLTVGQRLLDAGLRAARRDGSTLDGVAVAGVATFALAAVAQSAQLEAVLGAFIAGILLGRSRFFSEEAEAHLSSLTVGVLAPVFFATAGLRVDLSALRDPTTAVWALAILVAAVTSKAVGALVGARLGHLQTREGLALGAALNARGAVEVVIATVGLSLGVLSQQAYTAIVVMAIVTSMMAPPLLKAVVRGWEGTAAEQVRLAREELLDRNLLVRPGRLLLPSRGTPNSIVAAQLLHHAWPPDIGVTVLSIDEEIEADLDPILAVFDERDVEVRHVRDSSALDAILDEAKLGYSVIGVGASDSFTGGTILSPVVDDLLTRSPIPVLIVRRPLGLDRATPPAFERALVPVTGSPSARTAQEVAFNLSSQLGTAVSLLHVEADSGAPRRSPAQGVVRQAVALADKHEVEVQAAVRAGAPAEEIVAQAEAVEADLVILGATVRRLEDRPFLGHNVEHVLQHAQGTVVIVALPDPTGA